MPDQIPARGALAKLLFQKEVAYRTAPAAAAKVMPFTTYGVGREAQRQANNTVTSSAMPARGDAGDPVVNGTINSVLDLRSIGNWLELLLGASTPTGVTPAFSHTYPVNMAERPSALCELGHSDLAQFYRALGIKVNKMSWDILNNDQNVSIEVLGAVETVEVAAFDAAPTSYAQHRACSAGGKIYDGAGATLGVVVGGSIGFDNQMVGIPLADALEGFGAIDQGDLIISGTLRAVFDGATAYGIARANSNTRLKIISQATIAGLLCSLTVDMPFVELMEPKHVVSGKSGLFVDVPWKAVAGATLPTVVLLNDVASY
jgi:hypothetical protein